MDGNAEAGNKFRYKGLSNIHIPVFWIPAIPAGMTCFEIFVYNDKSSSLGIQFGSYRNPRASALPRLFFRGFRAFRGQSLTLALRLIRLNPSYQCHPRSI